MEIKGEREKERKEKRENGIPSVNGDYLG